MLVHSGTPLAPLDTVRALSPGRGRQSSAQGLASARPAATPLLETFRILADLIHWLARREWRRRPGKKTPGLPPEIVAASHIGFQTPPHPPQTLFPSASRSSERPRKMFRLSFYYERAGASAADTIQAPHLFRSPKKLTSAPLGSRYNVLPMSPGRTPD
jgi:hypothetical protein